MSYGTIKVDTITFTDNGSDVSVSVSGLAKNPTISGDLTVTGTVSGTVIQGGTTVSGATVTGTTANFVSGVYTTQISGATITGDTGQFTTLTGGTAGFTTVTGTISGTVIQGGTTVSGVTVTGTTANFVSGVYTTQISGATITGDAGQFTTLTGGTAGFTSVTGTTVTGTTANFVSGVFTTQISGATITGDTGNFTTATVTSGVFASGTAAAPSVSVGTTDNGLYSPGTNQVAISTSGAQALYINSDGDILVADGNRMEIDEIRARDGAGLKLFDDSGTGIFIQDGGNVGINITSPSTPLHVASSSGTQLTLARTVTASDYSLKFTRGNRTDQGIYTDGGGIALRGIDASNGVTSIGLRGANTDADSFNRIEFTVENSERVRIDSSGTFRVKGAGTEGVDDAVQLHGSAPANSLLLDASGHLLVGTSSDQSSGDTNALVQVFTSTAAKLLLGREDSVVEDDDFIGIIDFHSTDGGSQKVARIACQADGDHAADNKPGRLVFFTTPDNDSSPDEVMRITSDKYVRLASGTSGIQFGGDTAAANALNDYEEGTHNTTATCTSGTVTLASNTNELAYTKIGKMVTVHGRITVDTISNPTGNLTLSLPFVSADLTDSAGRCAGSIRLRIVDTGYDVGLFSCSVDENSSDFRITYGGSTDTVDAAPAMKAGTQIYISITYRTT